MLLHWAGGVRLSECIIDTLWPFSSIIGYRTQSRDVYRDKQLIWTVSGGRTVGENFVERLVAASAAVVRAHHSVVLDLSSVVTVAELSTLHRCIDDDDNDDVNDRGGRHTSSSPYCAKFTSQSLEVPRSPISLNDVTGQTLRLEAAAAAAATWLSSHLTLIRRTTTGGALELLQ